MAIFNSYVSLPEGKASFNEKLDAVILTHPTDFTNPRNMLVYQRVHFHHGFQMENQKKCGDLPVESSSLAFRSGAVGNLWGQWIQWTTRAWLVMTDGDGLVDWVYHIPGLVNVTKNELERSTIL